MSTKKTRTRANDAEIAARVQEVLNARLNGASFHDLQALAVEKNWDVSDRQLWRYVQSADKLTGQHFDEDRATLFRRHILQRRRLFAMALQDGDARTGLAVLKDEAELFGLYAPRKSEVSGPRGGPVQTAVVILPSKDKDHDANDHSATTEPGPADRAAAGTTPLPEKQR
jgi:hypothetical protein